MIRTRSLLSSLGAHVRDLRRARGWSRRDLAHRCSVSERFLADVESGRGNPSVITLADIAEALDTTASALLARRAEVIALLGLRGAGKSTIGKALARKRRLTFVELDAEVERQGGMSTGEIFQMHGEAYFRRLEREVLGALLDDAPRAVIATGGGLVTDVKTFDLLQRHATTVWLKARPEVHWSRVVTQGDSRPMGDDPRALDRLREIWNEREPLYRRAHHVVDVSDLDVSGAVAAITKVVSAA